MPITLPDLIHEQQVILGLRSRRPANAIGEIVQMLAQTGKIAKPEVFLERVLSRERTHPSVVENSVAFPHARTCLVEEIVVGVGRSRAGISFAEDQKRAHLIFVIAVPQRLIGDYLICVGTLVRLVQDESIRSTLLSAQTPREFVDALISESL